jgi:hypothetical protein
VIAHRVGRCLTSAPVVLQEVEDRGRYSRIILTVCRPRAPRKFAAGAMHTADHPALFILGDALRFEEVGLSPAN